MKKSKLSWWQWVLMYPTLAVAVLTSAPTLQRVYQSYVYGVSFGEVDAAAAQNDLWTKNRDCLGGKGFEQVRKVYDFSVSVALCPSGDVLVLIKGESKEVARWVSLRQLVEKKTALVSLGEVQAADGHAQSAQTQRVILCQARLLNGLLLFRVHYGGGRCADEYVNPFTGEIVKRVPAPCNSRCF